jgi:hypothetical protein
MGKGCGFAGGKSTNKETTVKHAPKSVFKKSNLASAVVVIVPENSHKTEDENENEDEEEAFN